eukprot:SAG31_NODE_1369_length_8611_cov_3.505169_4_plen_116_part_00
MCLIATTDFVLAGPPPFLMPMCVGNADGGDANAFYPEYPEITELHSRGGGNYGLMPPGYHQAGGLLQSTVDIERIRTVPVAKWSWHDATTWFNTLVRHPLDTSINVIGKQKRDKH